MPNNDRNALTYTLVSAAGIEAGNRSMNHAGRQRWNQDDYFAATREFCRLAPMSHEQMVEEMRQDTPAEEMERAR